MVERLKINSKRYLALTISSQIPASANITIACVAIQITRQSTTKETTKIHRIQIDRSIKTLQVSRKIRDKADNRLVTLKQSSEIKTARNTLFTVTRQILVLGLIKSRIKVFKAFMKMQNKGMRISRSSSKESSNSREGSKNITRRCDSSKKTTGRMDQLGRTTSSGDPVLALTILSTRRLNSGCATRE